MKKNHVCNFVRGCFCIFVLFFSSNHVFASNDKEASESGNFVQLSSSVSQTPGIATMTAVLENVDQIAGLQVDSAHKKVTVKEAGLYFILANGRIGTPVITLRGYSGMFLMRNGVEIPHTRANYSSQNKVMTTNLCAQTVLSLKKGDHISVGISSDSPNFGLTASHDAPSITFTMYKINN